MSGFKEIELSGIEIAYIQLALAKYNELNKANGDDTPLLLENKLKQVAYMAATVVNEKKVKK